MPVNINDFKNYTEYLSAKVQSGNTMTVPQFNQNCYQALMQIYEKDYQTFLATEEVSEFLKIYMKNIPGMVPPITGELSYPADYQHITSLRKYYVNPKGVGRMIQIEEVKEAAWGFIAISALQEPTLRFPKYCEFSNVMRFLPKNIGIIDIDYFKTPNQPVWGYTMVGGRYVYNPATSVDLEFQSYSTNAVAAVFLSLVGINIQSSDLEQFSQQYLSETKSLL